MKNSTCFSSVWSLICAKISTLVCRIQSLQFSPCNSVLAFSRCNSVLAIQSIRFSPCIQSLQFSPCNSVLAIQSLQFSPCNTVLALPTTLTIQSLHFRRPLPFSPYNSFLWEFSPWNLVLAIPTTFTIQSLHNDIIIMQLKLLLSILNVMS